jgi:hypothetical protein
MVLALGEGSSVVGGLAQSKERAGADERTAQGA